MNLVCCTDKDLRNGPIPRTGFSTDCVGVRVTECNQEQRQSFTRVYVRMTYKMHTFSHSFIPVKLSSTCFEQIIVHHQEVGITSI